MKWLMASVAVIVALLVYAMPAGAVSTLYAEGPSSASAGEELVIDIRLLLTEAINAVATTVHIDPGSASIVGFDDSDSVIRLWLQKGTPVEGGLQLEGIIPGGIGPAFTSSVSLGLLKIRPTTEDAVQISFSDPKVFLHLPVVTLDTVKMESLTIPIQGTTTADVVYQAPAVVVDADVRIVKDSSLFEGKRTLLFDIKTDQGTVDSVRMRERWFGVFGAWRDARNPSTLSDSLGVSILDVRLSETLGGAHVTSVYPGPLITVWILVGALLVYLVRRLYMKRIR